MSEKKKTKSVGRPAGLVDYHQLTLAASKLQKAAQDLHNKLVRYGDRLEKH